MNVIGLLKNAKSGNKEALALLHLGDDLKYKPPGQVTITNKEVVKEDLCTFTYIATAADRLGLRLLEEVARWAIQYAMYAYHSVSNMRPPRKEGPHWGCRRRKGLCHGSQTQAKEWKRGPKRSLGQGKTTKGRCKRWCPEKDCNYLGCNLPHDLQNKHHMSPKSMANKLSLKFARWYKGLEELTQKDVQETDSDPEEDTQS